MDRLGSAQSSAGVLTQERKGNTLEDQKVEGKET